MPKDDRWEALGWYCRLLIIQEIERGVHQSEIAERIGVTQPVISNIKLAQTMPSMATALALSEYFRRTPGELWNEALDWWEKRGGRQEALRVHQERLQARLAASEPKTPKTGAKPR